MPLPPTSCLNNLQGEWWTAGTLVVSVNTLGHACRSRDGLKITAKVLYHCGEEERIYPWNLLSGGTRCCCVAYGSLRPPPHISTANYCVTDFGGTFSATTTHNCCLSWYMGEGVVVLAPPRTPHQSVPGRACGMLSNCGPVCLSLLRECGIFRAVARLRFLVVMRLTFLRVMMMPTSL